LLSGVVRRGGETFEGMVGAWIAGLLPLGGFDLSWIAQFASLLVLPFAHEDLAIVAGAYIITNELMPASLVAISIYGGIVASDFALYGIGAGARRLPWLSRYADARVQLFSEKLRRNIFGLVALCRFVPGVVFVAFIACGWSRVSLTRFTLASLVVSAIYLPLTLYLVIQFGTALDDVIGWWTWPLLLGGMAAFGLMRKKVFAFGDDAPGRAALPALSARAGGHKGMPFLSGRLCKVAHAERIPPGLFYLPMILNWLLLAIRYRGLTLPTAANPVIPTGGMWGESKSAYFDDIAPEQREALAAHVVMQRGRDGASATEDTAHALALLHDAGMDFPVIAKPDIGWHGYGVRRIDSAADLRGYIERFGTGPKIILQDFVSHEGEAAVLYARLPGESHGRIRSLTFRYYPHVVGDGLSALRDLIRRDPRARWKARLHLGLDRTHRGIAQEELNRVPARGEVVQIALIGNQRAGGVYHDARRHITAAMEERFDEIARSMTEFHYGRFDIRFKSADALMRGADFKIVEVNGIGGEAIDAWDPQLTIAQAYRRLLAEQAVLFQIGDRNRARGFRPTPVGEFVGLLRHQTRLIALYPASE
jgi:membrane protein DedA with SNARE-associated domain